ncbi:hypothetical protein AB9F29_05730 [Falsihalocynthiibacter sp. S25ZX9]|uniref:hypothetical protein n=1 Tax=Falsihalocynthiibacter sp. S25ZX9 TaxID=3240870 RepID=UPI00350F320E
MVIGYTPLDPLVVLIGTALAIWFLAKAPVRLMAYLPTALSLYFFIPLFTLLTLWQTVPILLTMRVFLQGRLKMAPSVKPIFAFAIMAFVLSATLTIIAGSDTTRAIIRIIYYLGIFAMFSFCYEMGRKPDAFRLLLKGLVVLGVIYATYGFYQIVADRIGLPYRGILRGTSAGDVAYEFGFVRINSLANEPKRLGYVMFVCALACFFYVPPKESTARWMKWIGRGIFFMSLFTFSGSYLMTIVIFGAVALLLYPSKATKFFFGAIIISAVLIVAFPEIGVIDAFQVGYERRALEIEEGIDARFVYRQEFYGWDYLNNHPLAAFFGVGIGQYFTTLNQQYGMGVGFTEFGGLAPMNSTFLELIFDLSGIVAVVFYLGIAALIWKLYQAKEVFLCLALLFVTVQSFTILTLQFMILFAGVGIARLEQRRHVQPEVLPQTYELAE